MGWRFGVKRYNRKTKFCFKWFSMEKNSTTPLSKIVSPKNMLIAWALSLTLTANNPKVFAQKTQTQQEIFNMTEWDDKEPQNEQEKTFFINNFAHVINYVKDIDDLPYNPKYKNPQLAKKHNFPNKVDIDPKVLDTPKTSIEMVLWDKRFEIIPFLWIKIVSWEMINNKTLDDPKIILKLNNSFWPNVINMSCKELGKYAFYFNQIPKWWKKVFLSSFFTVREVSTKNTTPDKKLLTQNKN